MIHALVNPISGRAGRRHAVDELVRGLRRAGHEVGLSVSTGPGELRQAARRACQAGADLLIVWGGDGTASAVVDAIPDEGPPILMLPGGTANILAKYLRIRLNAARLVSVVHAGCETRLDVFSCTAQQPDATFNPHARIGEPLVRRFLLVGGAGFDAECVRVLGARRRGHISYVDYVLPIWRTFWGFHHPDLVVEADGEVVFEGPGLALLGNVPTYAVGLRAFPRALPSDGRMDLCIFRCLSNARILGHAMNVLLQCHESDSDVIYRQVHSVEIASRPSGGGRRTGEAGLPAPIQLDGDFVGRLPARFCVSGRQARFLVPSDWSLSGSLTSCSV